MADPVVLVDRPAAHVARLLINRPDKRNAIDHAVRQQIAQALTALAGDPDVRALVLGGVAGVFSAGGDLPSMKGLDEAGARARMEHIHGLCQQIAEAPLAIVSAIEGIGAGGAIGLALLGDEIVVGEGTRILFPFLGLGLTPDWGQLLTLPRRVGLPAARRLLIGSGPVDGAEAFRIGLADEVTADGQVMARAIERASALALLPRDALQRMNRRLETPSATLSEELAREADDQARCLTGTEFNEGYAAFLARRPPDFSNL